jgi:hypothetical protein
VNTEQVTKLIIEIVVAFGTLAVAVLAIWGNWFRSILAPAKLVIEAHTVRGDPTIFPPPTNIANAPAPRLMFYHLKVVNKRPWLPAQNCRVLLKRITRRGPDNTFLPVPLSVPWQFVWSPADITPSMITLVRENVLDFGFIVEGADAFIPKLYSYPNNFEGCVKKGDAVRYHLLIEATNYAPNAYQVFEVAWDGEWSYEPEKMERHLRITEVKKP